MRADFSGVLLALSLIAAQAWIVPIPRVYATHDPTDFFLNATASGWNSTTVTGCSPSGTPTCNPSVTEFRGVIFTITIKNIDDRPIEHDVAIYPKGYFYGSVSPTSPFALARSSIVEARQSTTLSFTPTLPSDNFAGPSGYEIFCEFHPDIMQSKVPTYKSPDLNGDGTVTVVDMATIAFAFGSTPNMENWNIAADIDNDRDVDIVDVATSAFYFGKTLVD